MLLQIHMREWLVCLLYCVGRTMKVFKRSLGPRTLHTTHKTAENAIILHTHYKFLSQLQQFFQNFFGQQFSQLFTKFCAVLRVV